MDRNTNHNKYIRKRIGAMLLSLVVAVTMMPVFAFAEEIPEQGAQAVDADAAAEAEAIQDEEVIPAEEQTEPENAEVYTEENAAEEPVETPLDETEDLGLEPIRLNSLPDSDELLTQYLESQAGVEIYKTAPEETASGSASQEEGPVVRKKAKLLSRRTYLNASEKQMYDAAVELICKVANGESSVPKAAAAMTLAEAKSIDFELVFNSLLTDLPYELYWHDKTVGLLPKYDSSKNEVVIYFSVAKEYRTEKAPDVETYTSGGRVYKFLVYEVDTDATKAVTNTAANAEAIVERGRDLSDLDKLHYYKNAVCDLTDYNNAAIDNDEDYGNPWQIIWVFDNDPSTKVVCEGYSKAFQFLFDIAQKKGLFSDPDIDSYIVTGEMAAQGSGGGHMWNVIHMDDGRNYIADVTNCDSHREGVYRDHLFLKGYDIGSLNSGYRFGSIIYYYDEDTESQFLKTEVSLSGLDYGVKAVHHSAKAATCAAGGNIEYWTGNSRLFSDAMCSQRISTAATNPLTHSWRKTSYLDSDSYRCARCGKSYSVSKVVVDLPKVSIKKPGRAKASFTAKWKKVSKKNRKKIGGIEIQYSTRSNFASAYTVATAKKTATSKKFKKLARKTTYYVRVRSYRWINGKKHVSAWSGARSIKTK